MQTPSFPDSRVSLRIEQLAQRNDLEVINKEYVPSKDLDAIVGKNGDSRWVWYLATAGKTGFIRISFLFPSYISNISFKRSLSEESTGHFFLSNYLSDYIKCHEDSIQIQQVNNEKSWKENWALKLDLLEKHLEKDLGKILNGGAWPEIHFNWQDYVEPAALDRIYQDQKDILDKDVPGKPRNAWVYFLDYFRKK